MTPYYEDESVTLYLADSASFIYNFKPPPGLMVASDPPNDRAGDIRLWAHLRSLTASLHITANVGVLDEWFAVLRSAGYVFHRATPWPRKSLSLHGDMWDALLHYGEDPGTEIISGEMDYTPETEFPGERNRFDWEDVFSRLKARSHGHPRVVFDPYPGSGSLLVAAASVGWKAIGVEIEPRFIEMAAARLADLGRRPVSS